MGKRLPPEHIEGYRNADAKNLDPARTRDQLIGHIDAVGAELADAASYREEETQRAERYRSDLDNCGDVFMALRDSSRVSGQREDAARARVKALEVKLAEAEGYAAACADAIAAIHKRAEAAETRVKELTEHLFAAYRRAR
jgi:hypothetical protein